MKILVLYEELALYLVNGFNVFAQNNECEILIISKKVNSIAPFKFGELNHRISIKEREEFSGPELVNLATKFSPDMIFLGGWIYKPYLNIVKKLNVKALIAFDNQWNGSLRQIIGSLYFKLTLKRYISKAFVAGKKQSEFARRLGFTSSNITEGLYCCDHDLFSSYSKFKIGSTEPFPKRFLFVGRYVKEKGIEELWSAFIDLQKEQPSDWELWCLGKGDIKPVEHERIKHFGFLQPSEMEKVVKNTGVFVLPSSFEPWGVVVHEYASAGFPLLCSDRVGANDMFLSENINGFTFKAENIDELKKNLNKFTSMSDIELRRMAFESFVLASKLTPYIWAEKLLSIVRS